MSKTIAMQVQSKLQKLLPKYPHFLTLQSAQQFLIRATCPALDASYMESFVACVVNTQPEANDRLKAFANKTAVRVKAD